MAMKFWHLAVAAVVIACLLNVNFPDNITNKTKARFFDAFIRIVHTYPIRLCAFLGIAYESQVFYSKVVLEGLTRFVNPWTSNDHDLQIIDAVFDAVKVRVYVPHERQNSGALVYIHGGGFVLFDIDAFEGVCRHLSRSLQIVTVSIEYRLAPKHTFPDAIADCERAVAYLLTTAASNYGVDPTRIAVIGDSAGGTLATVVSRRIYSRSALPNIKVQVLIYPLLQLVDFQTPSYQEHNAYEQTAFLDPESLIAWMSIYAGIHIDRCHLLNIRDGVYINRSHWCSQSAVVQELQHSNLPVRFRNSSFYYATRGVCKPPQDARELKCRDVEAVANAWQAFALNPEASPLLLQNLKFTPRTLVMTMQYDILRDEGILFVERLKRQGVAADWRHYDSGFHGMLNMHEMLDSAHDAMQDLISYLKKEL